MQSKATKTWKTFNAALQRNTQKPRNGDDEIPFVNWLYITGSSYFLKIAKFHSSFSFLSSGRHSVSLFFFSQQNAALQGV